ISDHLLPGRWDDIRPPSRKELAATCVLALPLDEASVKVSAGGPDDAEEDLFRPTWAGHVPLREVAGDPVPASDNRDPLPDYVLGWRQ
ncbi:MAG TPA: pyridoxamine 5'-phosphate oxidase family protein, partial [Candidatus Nanopelagicales bacterium]